MAQKPAPTLSTVDMSTPNVFILMGVSATGKTTLGLALAEATKGNFFDGDDYHPQTNRNKMASGQALNDDDRRPWLETLAQLAADQSEHPTPSFIACSALKTSYRNQLRSQYSALQFLHLHTDPAILKRRITERYEAGDHFMPPSLLDSQLAILEPCSDALELDVSHSINHLVERFLTHFPYS